jgi:glycosyltransferase involved in cell wall biosynthesis
VAGEHDQPSGIVRVAINLLTEDPRNPTGAHWCWTRVVPEMAERLEPGEELHLMVSPACRPAYQGYGPGVRYITYPWSNEHRNLRTLSEQIYTPARLPLSRVDVLNTTIVPVLRPSCGLVVHIKTMHAFSLPNFPKWQGMYRRFTYPRSARAADTIIVPSYSVRDEVQRYIDVDAAKFRVVPEAVDHELFKPGDPLAARQHVARYGVDQPFALFVSTLWRYKNCEGLLRSWAIARPELRGRQLVVVGGGKHIEHIACLRALADELGIASDVVWVGPLPLQETAPFYQAADVLVYPSFNETFGLPILEAMASGCPVVTSNVTAMPETAGGAAELCDPKEPASIAYAITQALGQQSTSLRERGLARAAEFSWRRTAVQTLEVYREVAQRRRHKGAITSRG